VLRHVAGRGEGSGRGERPPAVFRIGEMGRKRSSAGLGQSDKHGHQCMGKPQAPRTNGGPVCALPRASISPGRSPPDPPFPMQNPRKKLGRRRRPVFLPLSYKLRKAPPRHTRRGRWFGGVRPSFSGSVCETVWSSPARNAGRGARRPPPSRAICSDAFRGSKSDLRPLRLPGNVSGQAPPIERAKLDAQQSGIAIEGRRASWRRREPRSRHC